MLPRMFWAACSIPGLGILRSNLSLVVGSPCKELSMVLIEVPTRSSFFRRLNDWAWSSSIFRCIASVVVLPISCTVRVIVSTEDTCAAERASILQSTSLVSGTILVSIAASIVWEIRSKIISGIFRVVCLGENELRRIWYHCVLDTYTICCPRIRPTEAIGTAIRSCRRFVFFEVESAHCIMRGAPNILVRLLLTPRAGPNFPPTSSRKAANGARMWLHCSRRLSASSGSKGVACDALICCRVRERVSRNESVSWKSPPESLIALPIWWSNFKAATMSPADQLNDIGGQVSGMGGSRKILWSCEGPRSLIMEEVEGSIGMRLKRWSVRLHSATVMCCQPLLRRCSHTAFNSAKQNSATAYATGRFSPNPCKGGVRNITSKGLRLWRGPRIRQTISLWFFVSRSSRMGYYKLPSTLITFCHFSFKSF